MNFEWQHFVNRSCEENKINNRITDQCCLNSLVPGGNCILGFLCFPLPQIARWFQLVIERDGVRQGVIVSEIKHEILSTEYHSRIPSCYIPITYKV